jgi:hypothetical protein
VGLYLSLLNLFLTKSDINKARTIYQAINYINNLMRLKFFNKKDSYTKQDSLFISDMSQFSIFYTLFSNAIYQNGSFVKYKQRRLRKGDHKIFYFFIRILKNSAVFVDSIYGSLKWC